MDNLFFSAHKGERIRELIESTGCELLYLSACLLARLQPHRRGLLEGKRPFLCAEGAQARSRKALVEAIGKALATLTARDARGFLEHCGYRTLAQSF
jgi:hypothetical protein